jgi:CBS domain-containing protein
MIAADIMKYPVLSVAPDAPLVQAIRLMTDHHISGLPVVTESGVLVGVVTEGDMLRRPETGTEGDKPGWLMGFLLPGREADNYIQTHGRRVGEVMTTDVITVPATSSLSDVVQLMRRHHVKRLPVMQDGRMVGIVSRADIVRQVGAALASAPNSADDAAILAAINAAVEKEPWAPGKMVSIAVKDGVVGLDGCLYDLRERDAIGVLAENAPGVKRVENRIVCIEPYTGMVTYDPAAAANQA